MLQMKSEENKSLMRERGESRIKSGFLIAAICVGLSAIAVVPFFFMGRSELPESSLGMRMPVTHDMFLHYDQMRSFYAGLKSGEVYPRWEQDTNRGFGAPTTSYYPPGVYYLTSAAYAAIGDWQGALLATLVAAMASSGAAMYVYARGVMCRRAAVAAMSAYLLMPYHLVDQYQRGAIAELLGFVWMPLMLMYGDRLLMGGLGSVEAGEQGMEVEAGRRCLGMRGRVRACAGLAVSYGGFVWSHPPTAYQYGVGFMVYVLAVSVMRREWKGVVWVGAGSVLGVGLSAAYLLPAALEQDLIRKEYVLTTWPYHKTYVFVHDLFNYKLFQEFFACVDFMWILSTVSVITLGVALLIMERRASVPGRSLRQHVGPWVIL
ncbi:MAG TPA: hypothetical protein VF762_06765, partial [Blastocatellia bacterium]